MKRRGEPMSRRQSTGLRLRAVAGLLATLALALPAAADWTSFRGDAALTGVAREALPTALKPLWTFEAADGFEGTAAIAGGTVFVGSLDGNLYALELETGRLRFKYTAGGEIKSSPAVAGGTVYFGDEAGTFHALEAATGKARWTFKTDAGVTSSPTLVEAGGASLVLFGSYDGFLYALKTADGVLAWKVETQSYVHATPAVADGLVYISGCDGYLRAIRAANGQEAAQVSLGGYAAASPALAGGRAFVGTFENEVLSVDLIGLKVGWRYEHPERKFPFYSSAAVTPKLVVVGGRDKLVHALDPATGKEKWSFETPSRVDASPVVAGDHVAVATLSGDLYLLELASGRSAWHYASGSAFAASPAVASGRLVIGTADGLLYAFGAARDGAKPPGASQR